MPLSKTIKGLICSTHMLINRGLAVTQEQIEMSGLATILEMPDETDEVNV